MSTKIYNGYKLNVTWPELMPYLKKIKKEFEIIRQELALTHMAQKLTNQIDLSLCGFEDKKEIKLWLMPIELRDEAERAQNSASLLAGRDYSANLLVLPHEGHFLVLFYDNGCREYTAKWESLPEVSDYHYQNSTDKPEEISEPDWDSRKIAWDQVLPGSGIPSENGLTFDLLNSKNWYSLSSKEIFNFVPPYENRVHAVVERNLRQSFEKQWLSDKQLAGFTAYSNWAQCDQEFRKFMKTQEGLQAKSENEEVVKGLIPVEINEPYIQEYNGKIKS